MLILGDEKMRKKRDFRWNWNKYEYWIFMYIEKISEDDKNVRYKYLIDDDNMDNAGEIILDKNVVYEIYDTLYEKIEHIKNYFYNQMIKITKCPLRAYSNDDIEDYNAVYAAKVVIESKYLSGKYDEHFAKIELNHFEMYTKHMMDILKITKEDDQNIDYIPYQIECFRDYWHYIKAKKIYEDDEILCYQYFIDTSDSNDYGIVEFSKSIQIKKVDSYIKLYERLQHKGLVKVDKYVKTQTFLDIYHERRSIIIVHYILEQKKQSNCYMEEILLINKTTYDYYERVTHAIHKYGCDDVKAKKRFH